MATDFYDEVVLGGPDCPTRLRGAVLKVTGGDGKLSFSFAGVPDELSGEERAWMKARADEMAGRVGGIDLSSRREEFSK